MAKSTKSKAFDLFCKDTPTASYMADSSYMDIGYYLDTGCYMLNGIISKRFDGGIPAYKVTQFVGDSMTGKTYLMMRIGLNATKLGRKVLFVDTEAAYEKSSLAAFGFNLDEVGYFVPSSIENCRNKLVSFFEHIQETHEEDQHVIIIDSVANMESALEIKRISEDSNAQDMGTKARAIKSLLRNLNIWAAITKTTVVVTNQIFDNPDPMSQYAIAKPIVGGKAAHYVPSVTVQLMRNNVKEEEAKKLLGGGSLAAGQQRFSGAYLKALTTKNRFAKQYLQAELYLSFESGLSRYAGILEMAKEFGILTMDAYNYTINGEKFSKKSTGKIEIAKKLMPLMQTRMTEEWSYKNEESEEMPDDGDDETPDLDKMTPGDL